MRPILFIGLIAAAASLAEEPAFKLIVHESCPEAEISREDVSEMFLKMKTTWSTGEYVRAVDHAEGALRRSFTDLVHHKSMRAIRAFWQQQIFSGRDVPPLEKQSDSEVIAYVRGTPGAIGYVSAAAPLSGVKVIRIREEGR